MEKNRCRGSCSKIFSEPRKCRLAGSSLYQGMNLPHPPFRYRPLTQVRVRMRVEGEGEG